MRRFLFLLLALLAFPGVAHADWYEAGTTHLVVSPQDKTLRLAAADSHLHDGELAPARALLLTIALDPHSGDLAKLAAKMVADIDAGHPEAAIAEIEENRQDGDGDDKGKKK